MEINHITLPTAIIWENYPFRMFGTKTYALPWG